MKIIESKVETIKDNCTMATITARIFSKKYKIVNTINSADLAHADLSHLQGLTQKDKYLSHILKKFPKDIF